MKHLIALIALHMSLLSFAATAVAEVGDAKRFPTWQTLVNAAAHRATSAAGVGDNQ